MAVMKNRQHSWWFSTRHSKCRKNQNFSTPESRPFVRVARRFQMESMSIGIIDMLAVYNGMLCSTPVFAYCWLQARCKTEVIFSTCFSRSESTPPFVKCLHNRRLWNNSVLLLTVAAGDISHWPLTRAQAEFVSFTPCLQHMSGTVSPKPLCHMSAALSLCSSTSDAPTGCLIGGYRISTVLVFAYLWGQLKLLYQWSNFHQRQQEYCIPLLRVWLSFSSGET